MNYAVNFNLGQLFGGGRNQNQNNNNGGDGGQRPRINLGAIAGGILNGIGRPRPNQVEIILTLH